MEKKASLTQNDFSLWWDYERKFQSKEEAQAHLKKRMKKFIKETKTTQREIARRIGINEGALSRWKNDKDIFGDKTLYLSNAAKLNLYLQERGY